MTRTLKTLGLALLAVCAFGVVAASSASATTTDKITCLNNGVGVKNCNITATGSATFGTKSSGLTIVCSTEKYSGTFTNGDVGATEVTIKPTYEGCTALGGAATIHTNNCAYVLKGTTTSHEGTDDGKPLTDSGVTLECPNTHLGIVITAPACTISIETTHTNPTTVVNHNLHGLIYDDQGAGNTTTIKVTETVDTIRYTTSGFGCALAGLPSTGKDGTLTGTATAQAYADPSSHLTSDHRGLKVD